MVTVKKMTSVSMERKRKERERKKKTWAQSHMKELKKKTNLHLCIHFVKINKITQMYSRCLGTRNKYHT